MSRLYETPDGGVEVRYIEADDFGEIKQTDRCFVVMKLGDCDTAELQDEHGLRIHFLNTKMMTLGYRW